MSLAKTTSHLAPPGRGGPGRCRRRTRRRAAGKAEAVCAVGEAVQFDVAAGLEGVVFEEFADGGAAAEEVAGFAGLGVAADVGRDGLAQAVEDQLEGVAIRLAAGRPSPPAPLPKGARGEKRLTIRRVAAVMAVPKKGARARRFCRERAPKMGAVTVEPQRGDRE
jgi:hypothetical protein